MAVGGCTPRSLESRTVSRSRSVDSSTVRVRAMTVSMRDESDSRVRETACFMRLKRPDLGVSAGAASGRGLSGVSFLPPKSFIIEGPELSLEHRGRRLGRQMIWAGLRPVVQSEFFRKLFDPINSAVCGAFLGEAIRRDRRGSADGGSRRNF